jgi:CRISPR-associated protein Cas1
VACEKLSSLIVECLFKNQVIDNTVYFGNAMGIGIPQGSSLSPLLSNLYLDELDESLLKENFKLVRYADDFIVLTNTEEQAKQALNKTERVLAQLSLTLNPDKTQITHFKTGFSFLGHSFINELVLDNKSQLAYEANEKIVIEDPEDTQLALLSSSIIKEGTDNSVPEQAIETTTLAKQIFDQNEWDKTEGTNNKELGIILNTRIRSLYITTQGVVLSKKGNRLIVSKETKPISSIPLNTLDGVILFGRVHLTTDIMVYCLSHNMPVIFSSRAGSFHGILDNYSGYNETLLRQQMAHTNSLGKQLDIARFLLKSKFNNSLVIIKRIIRKREQNTKQKEQLTEFTENIRRYQNRITKENSLAALLGFEGIVAKQYFSLYQSFFEPDWKFTNRNRQPPKDPINVMLSLGYTILFNNIYILLKLQKLNPSFGYLHHGADEQPSLVLDLMEQFRATIIDATVYKLINSKKITLSHFDTNQNACTLSKEGFVIFLNAIENKLQSKISHPFTTNICDYRRIIDIQISLMKKAIKEDSSKYEAFLIR